MAASTMTGVDSLNKMRLEEMVGRSKRIRKKYSAKRGRRKGKNEEEEEDDDDEEDEDKTDKSNEGGVDL